MRFRGLGFRCAGLGFKGLEFRVRVHIGPRFRHSHRDLQGCVIKVSKYFPL